MGTRHTPGPWHLMAIGRNLRTFCPADASDVSILTVVDEDGTNFAAVYREEDARLIAAAPELLEALEAAVGCGMVPISTATEGGASRHSQQVAVADQIRAAIAKATQP